MFHILIAICHVAAVGFLLAWGIVHASMAVIVPAGALVVSMAAGVGYEIGERKGKG